MHVDVDQYTLQGNFLLSFLRRTRSRPLPPVNKSGASQGRARHAVLDKRFYYNAMRKKRRKGKDVGKEDYEGGGKGGFASSNTRHLLFKRLMCQRPIENVPYAEYLYSILQELLGRSSKASSDCRTSMRTGMNFDHGRKIFLRNGGTFESLKKI
ncbi:uncharacterized protein LOC112493954 [Cephus cinctus]|uniref:Uncharacterized protein LOC112493954 n=1 Tax=Cephus cinctus TaxID=211228 RepID=A0AAJ7RBT0_CEPCN|nr:uncharacterized protein LOC112493954 [Cephus cinctus]